MRRKALPATTYSEIIPMTEAQEYRVEQLEALGWNKVTVPEAIFNSALLMEDCSGLSHYIMIDGEITDKNTMKRK